MSFLLHIEGRFLERHGNLICVSDFERDVWSLLYPFVGKKIVFTIHHWPEHVLVGRKGGGCCLNDVCDMHDNNPAFLLNFESKGVLSGVGSGTGILKDNGLLECIPYEKVVNHRCRLIVLEELILTEKPSVESLLSETSQLKEALEQFKNILGDFQ